MTNQAKNRSWTLAKLPDWFKLSALLIYSVILLLPRFGSLEYFPGKFLWAEDGSVFLEGAQTTGLQSLWAPYAGYLQIYPRLVALISCQFELATRPAILIAGWLLAYLLLMLIVIQRATRLGVGAIPTLALMTVISLQPSFGETFFNITNSQWLLGAGLAIMLMTEENDTTKASLWRAPIIALLGLSGPFSIILLPAVAFKAALLRTASKNWISYGILLFCGVVQAMVLLNSGRIATAEFDPLPWNWFLSFVQTAMFATDSFATIAAAGLFWLVLAYCIFIRRDVEPASPSTRLLPVALLIAAALFIAASVYSSKASPLAIVSLGGGNRYNWVPFCLIMFSAAISAAGSRVLQLLLLLPIAFICQQNFHAKTSDDLQFRSFANFAKYRAVHIPTEPQSPIFPGWSVLAGPQSTPAARLRPVKLDLRRFSPHAAELRLSTAGLVISSEGNDPILLLDGKLMCGSASDVAVEVELERTYAGWLQFFWSQKQIFDSSRSLRRWYPSGQVTAQFAFPNLQGGAYLRLDPMEIPGSVQVKSITAYCLP